MDYKEKVRLAKEALESGSYDKDTIEYIFPELKESEDEKIRKALIDYFDDANKADENPLQSYGIHTDKAIAWLEKQDKQNPCETCEEPRLNCQNFPCEKKKNFDFSNKVEPKFKVGDIVKHKDNPHLTYILKRFTDDGDYEFHAIGKDGNEGCTCFSVVKYQDEWELVEQKPTVEMKTPEESLGIDSDTYNKIVDECIYGEQKPTDKVESKFHKGEWITIKE